MKKNVTLTPEQLEFLSLWSQGYSYVDIAKQIRKDVSTLRRWRKRKDIQLAMGAISQQKYEDTLHRDALVMEKLALSVFSKIDEASAKDVFWLYQSLSKKRINNNGPFPTNEFGMDMFKNQNTYFGNDVSEEIQAILDALDFDIEQ